MILEFSALILVVILGVAIGVPAYSRLLRILRQRHQTIYDELGQPTMMMASPSRSIGLQKFIYSQRSVATDDVELTSIVRFLRAFTIALVVAVIVVIALALRAALQLLSQSQL